MAKKKTRTTKMSTKKPAKAKGSIPSRASAATKRRKPKVMVDSWGSKQATFAEIQTAAYLRWLATGEHHVDCWLAAERELTVSVKGGKR